MGVTVLAYFARPCLRGWSAKTPMHLASARALLAVEELAGALTQAQPSGASLHGRFRDEEAAGRASTTSEGRHTTAASESGSQVGGAKVVL